MFQDAVEKEIKETLAQQELTGPAADAVPFSLELRPAG